MYNNDNTEHIQPVAKENAPTKTTATTIGPPNGVTHKTETSFPQ
jgi:hypothetical protein